MIARKSHGQTTMQESTKYGATGTATVTFTATDACGNQTSLEASVTIEDSTAPNLIESANDLIVECDGAGNDERDAWLNNHGGALAQTPAAL